MQTPKEVEYVKCEDNYARIFLRQTQNKQKTHVTAAVLVPFLAPRPRCASTRHSARNVMRTSLFFRIHASLLSFHVLKCFIQRKT